MRRLLPTAFPFPLPLQLPLPLPLPLLPVQVLLSAWPGVIAENLDSLQSRGQVLRVSPLEELQMPSPGHAKAGHAYKANNQRMKAGLLYITLLLALQLTLGKSQETK